jgi:hypothetical protein
MGIKAINVPITSIDLAINVAIAIAFAVAVAP